MYCHVWQFLGDNQPPAFSVCSNKTISSNVGRIYSPGFPFGYNTSLRCSVTVMVPQDKSLEIVVNYIDIYSCELHLKKFILWTCLAYIIFTIIYGIWSFILPLKLQLQIPISQVEMFYIILDYYSGCIYDELVISDGSTSNSTCGKSIVNSRPIFFTKENINVSFRSAPWSNSLSGFLLTYKIIDGMGMYT